MPLYEYQCEKCAKRFERIQKYSDPPIETCPSCGGPVKKLFSSPAIQFKGSGFYITDYPKKSADGGGSKSDSSSSSGDKSSSTGDSGSKGEGASKSESASKGDSSSKDKSSTTTSSSTSDSTTKKD